MTIVYVLRVINILTAALTAGGLVMVLMALYPAVFLPMWWPFSKKVFTPKVVAEFHRSIDLLPDVYMRPSTVISGLAALLILALLTARHGLSSFTAASMIIGLAGTIGVVVTSEFFNIPINRIVHGWQRDAPPPQYGKMLAKWGLFHLVRTLSSLVALVCYTIAGVER